MMTTSYLASVSSVGANKHDPDHNSGDRGQQVISLLKNMSARKRTTRIEQDHNRILLS